MNIRNFRGLLYPDDMVIRFFFKNGLNERPGRVAELGCGNGNNLALFYQYDWEVLGIDYNSVSLDNARHNFSLLDSDGSAPIFLLHDLEASLQDVLSGIYDCFLVPNVLNYVSRDAALNILGQASDHVRDGTHVFVRTRTMGDYRCGRGEKAGKNTVILDIEETGEKGTRQVFYHEHELVDMLRTSLAIKPKTMQVLPVMFMNLQQGSLVFNSDIVIWGQVGEQ